MLGYLCLCVSPWLQDVKENTVFCSASGAYLLIYDIFVSQFQIKIRLKMRLKIQLEKS